MVKLEDRTLRESLAHLRSRGFNPLLKSDSDVMIRINSNRIKVYIKETPKEKEEPHYHQILGYSHN